MRRPRASPVRLAGVLALTALAVPAQATLDPGFAEVDRKSPQYQRFRAYVDAAVAGNPDYGFSALDAAIMASLDDDPKYCALAVALVDRQVASAEERIAGDQQPEVAADSYLYAGQMIGGLAYTFAICGARLEAAQRQRWTRYADQAVFNIWNHRRARWGERTAEWSGWGTDNPGNNYYYSFVEATLTWALASGSESWIDALRRDKLPAAASYFADLEGGGSREGTGYGIAQSSMFTLFRLWRNNGGDDVPSIDRHAVDSIDYWIHATMPTLDLYAPIGDQARVSEPLLYDYHRRFMLEARAATADGDARARASWWLNNVSVRRMAHGFNTRHDLLPAGDGGAPPEVLFHHARGVGHLFARTSWKRDAMWLGFVAGPFEESHAHQDQGAFTLYAKGWLAVSENIWTHSGIQQDTDVQNVLRFEHQDRLVPQSRSPRRSALTTQTTADGHLHAHADLTAAYRDGSPVREWRRDLQFGDRRLVVHDRFRIADGARAVFQVNVPEKPVVSANAATAGRLRVRVLAPSDARIEAVDFTLRDAREFTRGWRIDIHGGGDEYRVELSEADSPAS